MVATSVTTMARMVDMALGSPEIGAVNYNVLHTLLHAMLQHLHMGEARAEMNADDREFLTRANWPPDRPRTDMDSGMETATPAPQAQPPQAQPPQPQLRSHYHQLEDKVEKIEKQLTELSSLPTNAELFERVKNDQTGTPPEKKSPKPVSDMWQQMQLVKLVDTNKEGVQKSMSLIDDIMAQLQSVREQNDSLQKSQEDMKKKLNMSPIWDKLADLEGDSRALHEKVETLPTTDALENFATWSGLEDGLKGVRLEMTPQQKPVDTSSSQTEHVGQSAELKDPAAQPVGSPPLETPVPPTSDKPKPVSRASTPGPSQELQNLLERLGKLTDEHAEVMDRLKRLEDHLKVGLAVDESQIHMLQEQVDMLKKARDEDSDALQLMQQATLQMQSEVEKLGVTTQNLIDDNNNKQTHIDTLYTLSNKLDDNKADKEYLDMGLGEKADRRLVDSKVNKVMFDSALDELNHLIDDILEKLTGHEDEWKRALEQMSGDIEGKLDRLEFGPIRDELERQLRQLSRRLKRMDVGGAGGDDDAAGFRKQLLQQFHCISCDRQVGMYPHSAAAFPSIPQQGQMPVSKSARPYTTYELEQIRQHTRNTNNAAMSNYERTLLTRQLARLHMHDFKAFVVHYGRDIARMKKGIPAMPASMPQPTVDVVDVYSTMRQCGGTHTMTYPHRRITRVTTYNQAIKDDEDTPIPNQKPEVDIQGADGHIYRGRFMGRFQDMSLLQNPSQPLPPRTPRRSQTSRGSRTNNSSLTQQAEYNSPHTLAQSVPPSNVVLESPRPQSTIGITNRNGLVAGGGGGGSGRPVSRAKSAASPKARTANEMQPKKTFSQPQSMVERMEIHVDSPAEVEVQSRPNSAANSVIEVNEAWQPEGVNAEDVVQLDGQASFEDFGLTTAD